MESGTKLGKAARHLKPTSITDVCSQEILPQPENETSIRKDHSHPLDSQTYTHTHTSSELLNTIIYSTLPLF